MVERTLLEVQDLQIHFYTERGIAKAVDGVNFSVDYGQTLGIVGESGCGKSVTALSLMQLVPQPEGKIAGGKILYYKYGGDPIDITSLDPNGDSIRHIRGNEIAMIFQEPMTSLNPVYTIGYQIMEAIRLHQKVNKKLARERAVEILKRVEISAPEQRINEYPHQLSGGMRQRAMIAMALSCNPKLLIADEPTTALDVTIEAQILALIKEVQQEFGMALLFITHDLGVIGEIADHVIVMYKGQIVEGARTREVFQNPKHPYTKGLLKARPKIGRRERLISIEGSVPTALFTSLGCNFAPRCPKAEEICYEKDPPRYSINSDHSVECWLFREME